MVTATVAPGPAERSTLQRTFSSRRRSSGFGGSPRSFRHRRISPPKIEDVEEPSEQRPKLLRLSLREQQKLKDIYDMSGGMRDFHSIRHLLYDTCGQGVNDEELQHLLQSIVGWSDGHCLSLPQFLTLMDILKREFEAAAALDTTVEAFIALGGGPGGAGQVPTDRLRQTVRDFELTLNIDNLIAEVDDDCSGAIDFSEFEVIFRGGRVGQRRLEEQSEASDLEAVLQDVGDGEGAPAWTRRKQPAGGEQRRTPSLSSLQRRMDELGKDARGRGEGLATGSPKRNRGGTSHQHAPAEHDAAMRLRNPSRRDPGDEDEVSRGPLTRVRDSITSAGWPLPQLTASGMDSTHTQAISAAAGADGKSPAEMPVSSPVTSEVAPEPEAQPDETGRPDAESAPAQTGPEQERAGDDAPAAGDGPRDQPERPGAAAVARSTDRKADAAVIPPVRKLKPFLARTLDDMERRREREKQAKMKPAPTGWDSGTMIVEECFAKRHGAAPEPSSRYGAGPFATSPGRRRPPSAAVRPESAPPPAVLILPPLRGGPRPGSSSPVRGSDRTVSLKQWTQCGQDMYNGSPTLKGRRRCAYRRRAPATRWQE
eukprot:TRINITY_DN20055_c0_g1_i1.p1 TRINITY_DN20055_c0_g1~~TRINITY_DN20055_c0_g1_i1.p1  ORF type:complete len:614 (+),score=137.32 TRINITY_DN20055_c0_g1_i1:57-1844(+)